MTAFPLVQLEGEKSWTDQCRGKYDSFISDSFISEEKTSYVIYGIPMGTHISRELKTIFSNLMHIKLSITRS